MPSSQDPIVIIGSGLAGYTLAQEFRKLDSETPLTILTRCDGRYYYKPSLSNALLKDQVPATFALAEVDKMQERLKATIYTDTIVTSINPEQRLLNTQNKKLTYSKLILACGADVIKPTFNAPPQALQYVNNLKDYESLREILPGKRNIAILGAGFVGCEFANTLAAAGLNVSVIAPAPYPLDRLLPEAAGLALKRGLATKGVTWYLEDKPAKIEQTTMGWQIALENNQEKLPADLILSTIGLRPEITLAQKAGLAVKRGVLVDRILQTSSEHIYALGDCAEVEGLVLQFVAPLLQSARALAKTLAGEVTAVKYPAMPIVLKTPACPLVCLPPAADCDGAWQISGDEANVKAVFLDQHQQPRGFALTGTAVGEKTALSREIPHLL